MARRPPSQPAAHDAERDELRAGRAALLDTLADLFLRELDLPTAQALAADPALAAALQPPSSEAEAQALRAEYARLLLMEAPPYASLFLEAPPVIGGESSRAWEATLAAHGLPMPPLERAAASDHAGHYLRALAHAERAGVAGAVLAEALRWLPQYLTTLEQEDPDGFYGRLAQLTAAALCECARHAGPPPPPADAAPAPPPEDDDLRTLTRWLCTPLWSGWYLAPGSLRALARSFGSPPGRIERAAVLEQAFEASGLDERAADLLDALLALLARWQEAADAWRADLAAWGAATDLWRERLAQTRTLLAAMREEAGAQPPAAASNAEPPTADEQNQA